MVIVIILVSLIKLNIVGVFPKYIIILQVFILPDLTTLKCKVKILSLSIRFDSY